MLTVPEHRVCLVFSDVFFLSYVQLKEVQVQVTESTTALKEVTTTLTETRRRYQALEIELQSALSLVRLFYAALH